MNKYLLSIVIATKNREKYCIKSIQSILNIDTDLVQICIADNSATEMVKEYLDTYPSERIVYQYDNSEISSIDNFNRAMNLADGEYICLIGDDDTVLPNIVDITKWAKNNNVDTISSTEAIGYYWPEARKDYPGGLLVMPIFKFKLEKIDAYKQLETLLDNGITNYLNYNLPKSYHGLVRRDLMLEIKRITGNFYGGLSPDIYSVVALSCISKTHYSTNLPFSILGVCATSTTADNINGTHCGEMDKIPHLKNRGPYEWDKKIPRYYSVTTIWADSGLAALIDLKKENLYKKFNMYPMLAQGILLNRKNIFKLSLSKTVEQRKKYSINRIWFWTQLFFSFLGLIRNKIKQVIQIKVKSNEPKYTPIIKDIQTAVSLVEADLNLMNITVKNTFVN